MLIHKTFEGLAERGKCSMGWFFGRFLENIKGKLCADKGYIGQGLFENLFLNGIQLVTKEKFTDEYC